MFRQCCLVVYASGRHHLREIEGYNGARRTAKIGVPKASLLAAFPAPPAFDTSSPTTEENGAGCGVDGRHGVWVDRCVRTVALLIGKANSDEWWSDTRFSGRSQ